jgi:hypothetical protein
MHVYSFLAALPAVLALAGFVLYQVVGAHRSGDEITRRILDKIRRDAPAVPLDERLNAKQVGELLESQQDLARIAGERDSELLKQALKQQFQISILVYVITIAFCAWSAYLFVRQTQAKKALQISNVAVTDRELQAGGLRVDLDPLTVTWDAQGEPEDAKVVLENIDTKLRTDVKVARSEDGSLVFQPSEYHALLSQREKGAVNRLRAVVQAHSDSFLSPSTDIAVGLVVLVVADKSGIDVAAMIDNSRVSFYGFEAKVLIPSIKPGGTGISIGPSIPYAFQKIPVGRASDYDWSDTKAVYFKPDDPRLVRYQYLIDNSLTGPSRERGEGSVHHTHDQPQVSVKWRKNWLTINEHRPHMGSSAPPENGGGNWTNRERFLATLDALDLSGDPSLVQKRKRLVDLIHQSRTNPNDPTYDVQYTSEMALLEDELRRDIRNRAVESGVDVEKLPHP